MPFDENGRGYGEHEGMHTLAHRTAKTRTGMETSGAVRMHVHEDDLEAIRAMIREEVHAALHGAKTENKETHTHD